MNPLLRSIVLIMTLCALPVTATADVFYDTYQRGLAAFKAREYTDARAEFLRAYDLRPEPVILFNIAQTYRLERDSEQAVIYYKRFLLEPRIAEALRNEAQAYLAALEAEQSARNTRQQDLEERKKSEADRDAEERNAAPRVVATPTAEPLRTQAPKPPSDTATAGWAATRSAAVGSAVPASPSVTYEAARSRPGLTTRRKLALFTAGSSVVTAVTGAMLGTLANRRRDQAYELCRDPATPCVHADEANALIRSSHGAAFEANIAFSVAATTAIAAVTLWVIGAQAPRDMTRVSVVPISAPGETSIVVTRSF